MAKDDRMTYVLECKGEFERLEKQSETEGYDFRDELAGVLSRLSKRKVRRILDAGCGSGIVSRYLSQVFPEARVTGCDVSGARIEQARDASRDLCGLEFEQADLGSLSHPSHHFDFVVCRYVMQHLKPAQRIRTIRELHRCLKPGGVLHIIDMDGAFFNLHPMPKSIVEPLHRLFSSPRLDFYVGRKLPKLLHEAGFAGVDWEIRTLCFQGELLETELRLNAERFEQMKDYLSAVLGSAAAARSFTRKFMAAWKEPGAVAFYNKFLITARKGRPELVKG
jgi:ubiquinone/menaquinone biosynthesis C-methylase UbiE